MAQVDINLTVMWHRPKWYRFNRYERGDIMLSASTARITAIHRKNTGQIRISTRDRGWPLDGVGVSINGGESVTIKRRGWYGRLHIWNP